MSDYPQSGRRRARMVGERHQVFRYMSSSRYGYGDRIEIPQSRTRFSMRAEFPEMDGSGNVVRSDAAIRLSRSERLYQRRTEQQEMIPEKWDREGMRGSIAVTVLVLFALALLTVWLSSVAGLIGLNNSNDSIQTSINTVENRIDELTADLDEAKANIDVAYQATGLGMVPASSTTVVKLSVPEEAALGPNGIANAGTVSVIR